MLISPRIWILLCRLSWTGVVRGMNDFQRVQLREQVREVSLLLLLLWITRADGYDKMFKHGYEGYMLHAYPAVSTVPSPLKSFRTERIYSGRTSTPNMRTTSPRPEPSELWAERRPPKYLPHLARRPLNTPSYPSFCFSLRCSTSSNNHLVRSRCESPGFRDDHSGFGGFFVDSSVFRRDDR